MWNHRIFTKTINERTYYCLREAFYDDNGEVHSWTEDTMTGYFDDIDDMKKTHELMLKDINKYSAPELILDEEEILKKLE
tara:strand:+ start:2387 stop:2626 length:240 start_codon:yes stop_codon:yes gene_type:complete